MHFGQITEFSMAFTNNRLKLKNKNMKGSKLKVQLLGLLAILTACGNSNEPNKNTGDNSEQQATVRHFKVTEQEKKIIDASVALGLNIMKAKITAGQSDNSNFCISPVGMYMGLSMLANGGDEEICAEICNALDTPGRDALNSFAARCLDETGDLSPNSTFSMANAVFTAPGIMTNTELSDILSRYFKSVAITLSGNETDLVTMNGWISKNTEGLIPAYFTSLPKGDVFLFNTLCLKTPWNKSFDVDNTRRADFHNTDGTISKVESMSKMITETISFGDIFSFIDLPMGLGAFNCRIILPEENVTLYDVISQLDKNTLSSRDFAIKGIKGELRIPKFSVSAKLVLNRETAEAVGLSKTFSPSAHFPGIICGAETMDLRMSQGSKIAFDEKGIKASSVTEISMVGGDYSDFEKSDFIVNRPFIFVITEKSSGLPLFIGAILTL